MARKTQLATALPRWSAGSAVESGRLRRAPSPTGSSSPGLSGRPRIAGVHGWSAAGTVRH